MQKTRHMVIYSQYQLLCTVHNHMCHAVTGSYVCLHWRHHKDVSNQFHLETVTMRAPPGISQFHFCLLVPMQSLWSVIGQNVTEMTVFHFYPVLET
jgi:hypothetical protein